MMSSLRLACCLLSVSPSRCEAAAGLHWRCTSHPSLALCHVLIAVLFPPPLSCPPFVSRRVAGLWAPVPYCSVLALAAE
jgi:hypothetical protein